jgi:hypothetical protein
MNVWRPAGKARSQDQRDFINGCDSENHSTAAIGERKNCRVGKKRLSAKNSLRLGAAELGAPVSDLEREKATYDGGLRRHVLFGDESTSSLPDSIAGDAKWRTGLDLDSGNDFPLARDRNPGETLTFRHGRTNRSDL